MNLSLTVIPGSALLAPSPEGFEGNLTNLARSLGRKLGVLVNASSATKPRGTKGFSFHWSNAQAKWDVIPANDATWGLDGAEFILYVRADSLSALDKPWSMKEMQYVAKALPPHPGFGSSMRMSARVAARFLAASPDKMEEHSTKAHGFELTGLFGWDDIGGDGGGDGDDEGYRYDREENWSFRDADMILYYEGSGVGRMRMRGEGAAHQLLKSLRLSKSVVEAVAVLTPVYQHDSTFRKFLQSHPQLTKKK